MLKAMSTLSDAIIGCENRKPTNYLSSLKTPTLLLFLTSALWSYKRDSHLDKAANIKTFILGYSFVRRQKDWMKVNGRVTRHGCLEVHQRGVGGRTVQQVYHHDRSGVPSCGREGMSWRCCVICFCFTCGKLYQQHDATNVLVKLRRLAIVLREKHSGVHHHCCFYIPSKATQKQQVNKLLLKDFVL